MKKSKKKLRLKFLRKRSSAVPIDELGKLVELMDERMLTEVSIQEGSKKIAVKRSLHNYIPPLREGERGEENGFIAVESPTVGIFYRAQAPGKPPLVDVGQIVEKGEVMALVEALKVMNEVRAPVTGKVVSVEAEDGELVDYGRVLFLMEEIE